MGSAVVDPLESIVVPSDDEIGIGGFGIGSVVDWANVARVVGGVVSPRTDNKPVLIAEILVTIRDNALVVINGPNQAVPPSGDLHRGDCDPRVRLVEAHVVLIRVAQEGLVLLSQAGKDVFRNVGKRQPPDVFRALYGVPPERGFDRIGRPVGAPLATSNIGRHHVRPFEAATSLPDTKGDVQHIHRDAGCERRR